MEKPQYNIAFNEEAAVLFRKRAGLLSQMPGYITCVLRDGLDRPSGVWTENTAQALILEMDWAEGRGQGMSCGVWFNRAAQDLISQGAVQAGVDPAAYILQSVQETLNQEGRTGRYTIDRVTPVC